jgi:deoxyribodipyrimidine photolyase-related protein
MKKIGLVFPHQLYKNSTLVEECEKIYLIEDDLYFNQYKFHKQKLVLHRASMKYYADYISDKTSVIYIQSTDKFSLESILEKNQKNQIHYFVSDDYLLERRINRFIKKYNVESIQHENPNFINTQKEVADILKVQKKYLMASFYSESRKRYKILLEDDNKPVGGKWSFDADNRKKVPKGTPIPKYKHPTENKYITEAKDYVEKNFKSNYGDINSFYYPITHQEAEEHLNQFIQERFILFGDYEDAIVKEEHWLWHSVLTPMLNIGLLCPKQIINEVLKAHSVQHFPLNSLEGFIRQILGWREFIRGIYTLDGVKQRTTNHFGYSRKIPKSFWTGSTGIVPIDKTIQKLLKTGYSHHIERLMIMGNFMMLCEFDPDEVYRWFMEMYVDAYDWVMVPNVYGMTQYADGGLMTTKPYCSGSNYILKMSDYKMGEWCRTWNALYWRFIYVNHEEFAKNRRMSMMVNLARKMEGPKMDEQLKIAEEFLSSLE